jgi:hypothetical protein
MHKRVVNLFGRRLVLCWFNYEDEERAAQEVVATLPDNVSYWGGFGIGRFLLVAEVGR